MRVRIGAGIIDLGVIAGGLLLLAIAAGAVLGRRGPDLHNLGDAALVAVLQLVGLLGWLAYLGAGWYGGGTVGARVLRLVVVDESSATLPTAGQCVRRCGGLVVSIVPLFAGLLAMGLDARNRGWHDRCAGTVVLERSRTLWGTVPAPAGRNPAAAEEHVAVRTPWTWTDIAPVLVLFYPMAIAATFAVSRGVRALNGGMPLTGDARSLERFGLDCAAYGLDLGLMVVLLRRRRHSRLRAAGFVRPGWGWLVAAVPLGLAAIVLSSALGEVSSAIFPGSSATQCHDIRDALGNLPFLTVLATAVVAPVAEEAVFRGFVYTWLRGRAPLPVAVLLSSALFSAAHFAYLQTDLFLPILGVGVVLACIYQLSGSIWPGIVVHATLNLVGTLVLLTTSRC